MCQHVTKHLHKASSSLLVFVGLGELDKKLPKLAAPDLL